MAGRSSMSVEVRLTVEDPLSGERAESALGRFVMVAVGGGGRPSRVPPRTDAPVAV
jgi:acyl-CoA hydrolase